MARISRETHDADAFVDENRTEVGETVLCSDKEDLMQYTVYTGRKLFGARKSSTKQSARDAAVIQGTERPREDRARG